MRRLAVAVRALWTTGCRALRLAVVVAALGLSQPVFAQLREIEASPPRQDPCADANPPLVFSKEDFEQGFDRIYTFPDITECDGSGWNRSGRLRLTYPASLGRIHAEIRYETRRVDPTYHGDCVVKFGFQWSGDLEPHGDDPEGLYPAASFESAWTDGPYVRADVFGKRECDDTGPIDPRMRIRLGLVYWDGQAGAFVRRAFLEFDGLDLPNDVFGQTESDSPESALTVAGCLNRAIGTFEYVTAQGRPPGGSYRWTAEPSSVFGIDGADERAIVTAEQAGHATLQVQYETPEGNHLFKSLSGSVVDLRSVNSGAAIPEIGLKDENGKDALPIRVPIDQDPPDGGLVRFESEDPGIATLYNEGTSLLIQGVNPGSTTAQGQTSCGDTVGSAIAVKVVRCTQETIDGLRAKEDAIKAEIEAQVRKIPEILEDPEFQRAHSEFKAHLADAILKAAEVLAIGAGAAAHGSSALQIIEPMLTDVNMGLLASGASDGNIKDLMLLSLMFTPYAPFVIDYEVYHSWHLLIGDVSTFKRVDQQQLELKAELDRLGQKFERQMQRRFEICGRDKEPTGGKKDPPPPPQKEPPQQQDEPMPKVVPADEGQETQVGEEPEPPPVSPPPPEPPTPGTKSGGFSLERCGCDSFKRVGWNTGASGLGTIGVDLGVAESCGNAMTQQFGELEGAMQLLGGAGIEIQQALSLPETERVPLLEAASSKMKKATTSLGSITQAASAINESFRSCDAAIPEAISVMKESGSEMAEIAR